jgi:tetratricopeptide (TPR) repeat protein
VTLDQDRLDELRALGYVAEEEPATPAAGDLTGSPTAELNLALLAKQRGDMSTAVQHLEKVLQLHPGFAVAMLELSDIHRRSGNTRLALAWLAQAMGTNDPGLPSWLPVVFVRESIVLGKLEGALDVLAELPDRWKALPTYRTALGIAAFTVGRKPEARAMFESALAMSPAELDALDGILRLRRDFPDLDWHSHLEAARAAVATDLSALRRLAWLCANNGLHSDSEACLRAVLASDPNDSYSLHALALTLRALGRDAEAAEVEKHSRSATADDAEIGTAPLPPWPAG